MEGKIKLCILQIATNLLPSDIGKMSFATLPPTFLAAPLIPHLSVGRDYFVLDDNVFSNEVAFTLVLPWSVDPLWNESHSLSSDIDKDELVLNKELFADEGDFNLPLLGSADNLLTTPC